MACIGDRTTACTLIIVTLCALYYTWFGFEIKKYFKCLSLDIKRYMKPDISDLVFFPFPHGLEFPFSFVAMDHWAQFSEGYSISPLLATIGYSYWIERLLSTHIRR